jgi:mono/diheme cytochrome c family protein
MSCDDVCIDAIEPTLAGANGIQERVFEGSCAFTNCHGAEGLPQAELELSSATVSADNLIDVQSTEVDRLRVAPGDTGASYLVDKLLGQNLASGTARMPNVGVALCDAKIQAVEAWIEAGAN